MTASSTSLDPSRSAAAGARIMLPVLLGIAPFGLVAGIAAVDAGYGLAEALGFSVAVFAGASQLAALELLGTGAPVWITVMTAVVINLRMSMYSASLAPWLTDLPRRRRLAVAYVLTDQLFAVAVARFQDQRAPAVDRFAYAMGAGFTLWAVWQISTVVGVFAGAAVPADVPLGFAVPLAFLAMLVPAITDRPTLTAALVGGAVSLAGAGLPANAGLILGAVVGVLAGFGVSMRAHPGRGAGPEAMQTEDRADGAQDGTRS